MLLALDILLTALAVVVLVDLIRGLARGRLQLMNGDRAARPMTFWGYVAVEAILVALVASIWL